MVIYSRAILVTVTSECNVRPRLGYWQTVQTQIRRHRTRRLIRVCTVCFNYRKLRIKWNNLTSPFRTIFPAYTQRKSTHQCCQYFDFLFGNYSGVSFEPVRGQRRLWADFASEKALRIRASDIRYLCNKRSFLTWHDIFSNAPVICIHCHISSHMGNCGDSGFPAITTLLNTPHCGDNWIVKAQLFPTPSRLGKYTVES